MQLQKFKKRFQSQVAAVHGFNSDDFYARQHYSAYMLSPVRLSVCPSVRDTGGLYKSG